MRSVLLAASLLLLVPSTALADVPEQAPALTRYAPPVVVTYAPAPEWTPSPSELPPPDLRPSGRGMLIGGIVSTSLGGVQALGGAWLLFKNLLGAGMCGLYTGEACVESREIAAGAVLLATSAIPIGIGIALIVRGKKINRAQMARAWHGAPGGAGWAWSF